MNNDFDNKNEPITPDADETPKASSSDAKADEIIGDTPTQDNPLNAEQSRTASQETSPVSDVSGTDAQNKAPIYSPQSGSFSYSKPDADKNGEKINGCMWQGEKPCEKPKKKSSKGFKVFAACMLSVFTVSIAAIAVFITADYFKDHSHVSVEKDQNGIRVEAGYSSDNSSLPVDITTMLSTFKDEDGNLTKSQVAMKCSPSSVGIVVEVEIQNSMPDLFGFEDFGVFGDYFSQPAPKIAKGVGSGFIFNKDGYIITNHHVVEDARKITVYLSDKTTVEAQLIGSDALSDIAVIKVDPDGLNLIPMEIGDSSKLVVGDEVIAIGCPAGIEYMGTVTDGIISAINRDVDLADAGPASKKTMTLLQTNATINKGNSGGPLINSKGQVIGINTLKLGANYEGIGFSIPINGALPIIDQLMKYGEVKERTENDFVSSAGVIGISASPISESEAEYYDIPRGVLVVQIDKDGSAAKAGLRRGDIITAFNGESVTTVGELNQLKSGFKAGESVTVTVYRDTELDRDENDNGKDQDDDEKTFDITFKLDVANR